jgi:hypothetical protein
MLNPATFIIREGQTLLFVGVTAQQAAAAARGGEGFAAALANQPARAAAAAARMNRGAAGSSSDRSAAASMDFEGGMAAAASAVNGEAFDGGFDVPGLPPSLEHQRRMLELTLAAAHGGTLDSQDTLLVQAAAAAVADANGAAANGAATSTAAAPPTHVSAQIAVSSPSPNGSGRPASLGRGRGPARAPVSSGASMSDSDELSSIAPVCLAGWSSAFETESFDEGQLCDESEVEEATMMMRDWATAHSEAAAAVGQPGAGGSSGAGRQWSGGGGGSVVPGAAGATVQDSRAGTPALGPLKAPRRLPNLSGHIIITGCEESFRPFALQLRACCSAQWGAPQVAVLHPDPPLQLLDELSEVLGRPVVHIPGRPSDSGSLELAGASRALSLAYLGPAERPSSSSGGSAAAGGPQSLTSRAAVLADSEALAACYGVGEEVLPGMMNTVVELGFTSSIRFLQPGLLLHGRTASGYAAAVATAAAAAHHSGPPAVLAGKPGRRTPSPPSRPASRSGGRSKAGGLFGAAAAGVSWLSGGGQRGASHARGGSDAGRQSRTSWRHRKQVEEEATAEGLTEWQVNSYYAAGRVLVPALLDVFTTQAFFRWRQLLDLMQELAGGLGFGVGLGWGVRLGGEGGDLTAPAGVI